MVKKKINDQEQFYTNGCKKCLFFLNIYIIDFACLKRSFLIKVDSQGCSSYFVHLIKMFLCNTQDWSDGKELIAMRV